MTEDLPDSGEAINQSIGRGIEIAERGGAVDRKARDEPMLAATAAPTDSSFRVFQALLDSDGLRYALYSILRLTNYRFISVFALKDDLITSLAHVDREDLSIVETDPAAESASYCCYVRRADGPFAVVDSLLDPRVDGHEKQRALRTYCGVPITSAGGDLLGTLCHYDVIPRDPAQLNGELLAKVAHEIATRRLL